MTTISPSIPSSEPAHEQPVAVTLRDYPPPTSHFQAADPNPPSPSEKAHRLAPFNPTCEQAQRTVLSLAQLTPEDVLCDVGCGDGRFLMLATASVPGLRGLGLEVNDALVARAQCALSQLPASVQSRIQIRCADVLDNHKAMATNIPPTGSDADLEHQDSASICNHEAQHLPGLSQPVPWPCAHWDLLQEATVIYLYLLPQGLVQLRPVLEALVEEHHRRAPRPGRPSLRVVTYMFQIHGWTPTVVDRSTKGQVPLYLYQF